MSKAQEITICHTNEMREVNKTSTSPRILLPWSPFIIDQGAKAIKRNAWSFKLYSRSTKDLLRTLQREMSIHKKTKQNNNNNNYLTIHTRSQKSTNTSAIWVNSNIFKSVQDELYIKTAPGFSILRSISRKSQELVWAEERDILRDILWSLVL